MKNKLTLIEQFYQQLWNQNDRTLARKLLHPEFDFRGSVGVRATGPDQFLAYMDRMQTTFPDFYTEMVQITGTDSGGAISRQLYRGTHLGNFFDVPATGRKIEYAGIGFFEFEHDKIRSAWVLGDLLNLYDQLGWTPQPDPNV